MGTEDNEADTALQYVSDSHTNATDIRIPGAPESAAYFCSAFDDEAFVVLKGRDVGSEACSRLESGTIHAGKIAG